MKALVFTGGIAAVAAVVAVVWALGYWVGVFGNNVQASYNRRVVTSKIQQSVNTPAFAQEAYERFYTDCTAIIADNEKVVQAQERVAAMQAAPDDGFGQRATRVADAISDLAGIEATRSNTAASYNAASLEWTRGQFKAASLPYQINPPYSSVSCGSGVTP